VDWYYVENGQQIGPVPELEFETLVQLGRISTFTPVWREGMSDWQQYGSIGTGLSTAGLVTCCECKREYPRDEVIQYKDVFVCAACKPLFFQKVKEGARLTTSMQYGTFWLRFAARFIDGILIWLVEMAILVGAGATLALLFHKQMSNPNTPIFLLIYPVLFFVSIGYSVYFVGKYGATPGKMMLGMKIVTSTGEPLSYARALGRFFAEMISALTCYIGYIMAAFDEESRALHDRICDTRVVKKD
jgi:uncharacterized RDD family membrane protein YckC